MELASKRNYCTSDVGAASLHLSTCGLLHSAQLPCTSLGLQVYPLCRNQFIDPREKSNLCLQREVGIEQGCQARQSPDPHKLRGSRPQEGSLTSDMDRLAAIEGRAAISSWPTVTALLARTKGEEACNICGSSSLARCYRRKPSRPLPAPTGHPHASHTRHAHGREFRLLLCTHASVVR
jgi:hypothetical protein